MKNKFIRILSPFTLAVIALLDIAVIAYGIFAIIKLKQTQNATVIIFSAIEVFAIIVGILVTKEVLSNGVIFRDDECEFTGVDKDNIISYEDIEEVETYKDTAASLKKNFISRHALIHFTLKDDRIITIDIGLASNKALKNITEELGNHIDKNKIKSTEVKTADMLIKIKGKDGPAAIFVTKEDEDKDKEKEED